MISVNIPTDGTHVAFSLAARKQIFIPNFSPFHLILLTRRSSVQAVIIEAGVVDDGRVVAVLWALDDLAVVKLIWLGLRVVLDVEKIFLLTTLRTEVEGKPEMESCEFSAFVCRLSSGECDCSFIGSLAMAQWVKLVLDPSLEFLAEL